jgi:hypothetical protein
MVTFPAQSRRRGASSDHAVRSMAATLALILGSIVLAAPAAARIGQPSVAPLPLPRPPELMPAPAPAPIPTPAPSPTPEVKVEPPVPAPDDCFARLTAQGWEAEAAAPVQGAEACTIQTPVLVKRLRLKGLASERSIDFPARPIIACAFAERLGHFVSEAAVPMIAGGLGTDLKAIDTGPGFSCRTRNHVPNAKMSAHGLGIALDVAGFELANGKRLPITQTAGESEVRLLAGLRTAACGWFMTILGPGTDPSHATHWHFDILKHGSSDYYRICQ